MKIAIVVINWNGLELLKKYLKKIVDNSSETEKLTLINAHPELGKRLHKKEKLTKFSENEQKSAGLDQCTDKEFEIDSILDKQGESFENKEKAKMILAQIHDKLGTKL